MIKANTVKSLNCYDFCLLEYGVEIMRLIVLLMLALILSMANLPIVKAMPSVLVDTAAQRVYVNSARNQEIQELMNKRLAEIKLAGGMPRVLTNNVSVLSIMIPTAQGNKAITFDTYSGSELKINEIVAFNPVFQERVAKDAKEISGYAVADGALLVEKNGNGNYESIPFGEIITALNINKLVGCFEMYNLNEAANGLTMQVKSGALLAVVLPADKLRGEGWRNIGDKNNQPIQEIGRSYVMANPRAEEYGYEIVVFSAAGAGEYTIKMQFDSQNKKVQKNFSLNVLVN